MNSIIARWTAATSGAVLLAATGFGTLTAMGQTSSSDKPPFGIVIHGGAGTMDRNQMTTEREAAYRKELTEALNAGYAILERGGTSIEAVSAAIVILENSPLFNAGKGAVLNLKGKVELDAAIMDGNTLAAGTVTGVTETENPILLARAVMEHSPHVMLAGVGAEAFARQQKLPRVPNSSFQTERRRQEWERAKKSARSPAPQGAHRSGSSDESSFGTVGAVALDRHGNLAAGTSTGGRLNKMPGRVGDTPIIGAGTYANNRTCAVSATGHGEFFMRTVAAHAVAMRIEHGRTELKPACEAVLNEIHTLGGSGGVIAIDRHGRVATPFTTPGMYRGYRLHGGDNVVGIWKD